MHSDWYTPAKGPKIALRMSTGIIYNYGHYIRVREEAVWAGIAQSVQRLATVWTVRGSMPGEGIIFRTRLYRRWGPPSHL